VSQTSSDFGRLRVEDLPLTILLRGLDVASGDGVWNLSGT
jgi:hypothetical protein